MRSLKLASVEVRRLLGVPLARAALVAVACVPLLYGALYLWAFWNPYGNLDKMPVAIVNLDRAAVSDGRTIDAGRDLTSEILDSDTFAWRQTTLAEARSGLDSGNYYLALVIPRDFSATLSHADSANPKRARLRVYARESSNMLASMIGERAFSEVRAAASASASKGFLDRIFVGFSDSHGQLVDAAAGARDLATGLADARRGAAKLAGGTTAAHDGASSLASGLGSLSAGTHTLASGASRLASGGSRLRSGVHAVSVGADRLAGSATQLSVGAKQLATGVDGALSQVGAAAAGAGQVRDGASAVDAALHAYLSAHPDAATDSSFQTALGASGQVKSGTSQLASGLGKAAADGPVLSAGAHALSDGAGRLAAGAAQLAGGAKTADGGAAALASASRSLAAGSGRVSAGSASAASGARTLAVGVARLDEGSRALASGLGPAAAGSRTLASGLRSGAAALPSYGPGERAARAQMMADPVGLSTTRVDPVPNYGTGFSPYFLPLALWIGALMAYFIVRPLPDRALATGASPLVAALAGYWPAAGLALVQTTLLYGVVRFGLGLAPASPAATLAIAALAALAFTAVLQFLAAAFGPVGKLLSIVLLMLQLTSSAGTFPIQTVPTFFQAASPLLPMTYVVAGLRASISGGDLTAMTVNALVVVAFGAAALLGTTVAAAQRSTWTMERLRPSFDI